ncbi:glycosyltransferase family 4 protein [Pseudoalteromonas lipolytica]|uniref:glycosyltransferase family 4 protein n=1 Tax=Pseudoalteromonas lipolytica TaxID=570156 RepID=UPI003BA08D32
MILFVKGKCRITAHFVGDSLDATWQSSIGFFKKLIKSILYLPEYFLLLLFCKKYVDNVYTNGEHLKNRLSNFGVKAKSVVSSTLKISDAVDKHFLIENNRKIKKLLFVGYLRPAKGVFELLSAFKKIVDIESDISLSIVGDGESSDELSKYVMELGLVDKVFFLGHIDSQQKLKAIYQSHDLFCFPSRSEGSPRVIVEAMFFGLLVVSNRVGSLPFSFESREIFFTDDFSLNSLFNTIFKALKADPEQRLSIKISALEKVKNNYSIEQFLDEVFS